MKDTLNLLPAEIKEGVVRKKDRLYYFFLGVAVYIIVMAGMWLFKTIEVKKFNSEIEKLNKQRAELQQKIVPPPPPPVTVPSVDREISEAMERTPRWSMIISSLSVIVPKDVWLSSIESQDYRGVKAMSIKGFSSTQFGVANLISELEASRQFYDVEIVFSQKGEKDISFELKARLRLT